MNYYIVDTNIIISYINKGNSAIMSFINDNNNKFFYTETVKKDENDDSLHESSFSSFTDANVKKIILCQHKTIFLTFASVFGIGNKKYKNSRCFYILLFRYFRTKKGFSLC